MKVLIVTDVWYPAVLGGAEIMGHDIAKMLVEAGHSVYVEHRRDNFAPKRWDVIDGVTFIPWSGGDTHKSIVDADVVMTQNLPYSLTSVHAAARSMGKPTVLIQHSNYPMSQSLWRQAKPDLTIFNSLWLRDHYCNIDPDADFAFTVMHPHVKSEDYATSRGDKITFVNLTAAKGVKLAKQIAVAMPDEQFLFVVGGYGQQEFNDLPENVELHPLSRNMRDDIYSRTKLVLMPSHYESWGRVATEAACSGIPTVANGTPGLREALGSSGFIPDDYSLDPWVGGIRTVLDKYDQYSAGALSRADELDAVYEVRKANLLASFEDLM